MEVVGVTMCCIYQVLYVFCVVTFKAWFLLLQQIGVLLILCSNKLLTLIKIKICLCVRDYKYQQLTL